MNPDSILSGWAGTATNMVVRISNAGAGNNDVVSFWNAANSAQLPLGSVNLGRSGYVNTGTTITFGASGTASSMVQSGAAVTITLGTPSTATNRVGTNTTLTWSSSATPTDLAGNSATGNTATQSGGATRAF